MITPQLLQMISKKRGNAKMHAISALLKQKNFLSRLNTKSRRGPSTQQLSPIVNPQGKLPHEARKHDMDVWYLIAQSIYRPLDVAIVHCSGVPVGKQMPRSSARLESRPGYS